MRISKDYRIHEVALRPSRNIGRDELLHVLVCHLEDVPNRVRLVSDEDAERTVDQWNAITDYLGFSELDNTIGPDDGVAIATDGHILVVVPVQLEEGDQPGLVRADAFLAKYQERKAKFSTIDLRQPLFAETYPLIRLGYEYQKSHWVTRTIEGVARDALFPNFIPVIAHAIETEGQAEAMYDADLLRKLGLAMGQSELIIKAHQSEPGLVRTYRKPSLPIGLVMPMYIGV